MQSQRGPDGEPILVSFRLPRIRPGQRRKMPRPDDNKIRILRNSKRRELHRMTYTLYLLHFEEKLEHAQHYVGITENLEARLKQHANGQGARITQVLFEKNMHWKLARMWKNASMQGAYERLFKRMKNGVMYCPVCYPYSARCFRQSDDYPIELIQHPYTSRELRT